MATVKPTRRWSTDLGSFVRTYVGRHGMSALMRDLDVSNRQSIYHWIAGRSYPAPNRARALVQLSGGALTMEDVYRQRTEVYGAEGIGAAGSNRNGRQRRGRAVAGGPAQGDRRN